MNIYLDIDDVLADTARHLWSKIFWNSWANDLPILMKKYKRFSNFPWVKDDANMYAKYLEAINSNEFQEEISPIEENMDAVKQIHANVWKVVWYITTRPKTVTLWTERWIKNHWLPSLQITHKPKTDISDWKWKTNFLSNQDFSWFLVDDNTDILQFDKKISYSVIIYSPFAEVGERYFSKKAGICSSLDLVIERTQSAIESIQT